LVIHAHDGKQKGDSMLDPTVVTLHCARALEASIANATGIRIIAAIAAAFRCA
jgi:hypothetical protein